MTNEDNRTAGEQGSMEEEQHRFDERVMRHVAMYARSELRLTNHWRTSYATLALASGLDDSICWMEVVGSDGRPLFEERPSADEFAFEVPEVPDAL